MKKLSQKSSRTLFRVLLGVVLSALLIAVSVAVYTNQGYKKGVAITTESEAMFSSSMLKQISISNITDENNYATSDVITGTAEDETRVNFSFEVYNYAPNTPTRVNPADIIYDLTVTLTGSNITNTSNYSVKNEDNDATGFAGSTCTISNLSLRRGVVSVNRFTVTMPKQDVTAGVKFAIKAVPHDSSRGVVNDMGLAIVVTPVFIDDTPAAMNSWSGRWVEKTFSATKSLKPSECSAFNYEISGVGKGKLTLEWPDALEIDPFFLESIGISESSGNSVTFPVDSSQQAAYTIRFYRTGTEFSSPYAEDSFTDWPSITTFVPDAEATTREK
jgi:hypothetical protein